MKTIKFFATLGIHEGYHHENKSKPAEIPSVEVIWQEMAAKVQTETGIYVSAVFMESKTVYHTEWGCPVGGEITRFITGECNPTYNAVDNYKESVKKVLHLTAQTLRQSTTQLTFMEAEFVYMDFR